MTSWPRELMRAAAVVVATVAIACGGPVGSGSPTGSTAGPPSPRPSSTAVLTIVSPTNGQVITGGTVALKIDLKGATLTQVTSTDLKPDEGHLHVIMDDTLITMTSGLETIIPAVPPGRHLIKVEFVANDHAPFDPRVIAAVAFVAK